MKYDVRIETFEEGDPLPSRETAGYTLEAISYVPEKGWVYHVALFYAITEEDSDV